MLIKIKNFEFKAILGIYEWEEKFEREIILNATIETSYDQGRFTHDIKDTIDYDEIIAKIKNFLSSKKFRLIEEMTQEVLDLIMEDKRIEKCTLEIDKMRVVENVESFSITLTQENKSWI